MSPALRGILQQLSDIHTQRAVTTPEFPLILQALNMIAEQLEGKHDADAQAEPPNEL